ncbi:serine hydrolase domain-containing protein [Paraburkholderia sacchari]|uniref:Beta-lactamase family protein n=2 Tax=Paraburkholderia sacchari TaxID=159450 RepID=A0A8T6ZDK7_9BURK|nr:serine hydrolase domain-containing protein [Paraburkholderia sacchari]NLP62643.1 beta-lactamase family protein [Paraburkholderia sacchari]
MNKIEGTSGETLQPLETAAGATLESASRRRFLGYTGAGMLAVALPGCGSGTANSSASTYANTRAWAESAVQQAINLGQTDGSAVSMALLKGNQIVWQKAFGSATSNTAATTLTRFNIGSVSKVVAALAAMILQDRGLLNLDTPIVQYLPSFKMLSPAYTQITTRHLLSHASGLPGFVCGHDASAFVPVPGDAELTMQAFANMHLKHLPGQMASYNNDGFTMIEPVVQAVSGQSYPDFVTQNILAPLGMTNSGFLTSAQTSAGAEFAYPYINGAPTSQLEYYNTYASGGLNTTPGDMMNLAQMLIAGGVFQGQRIVSAAGVAQMGTDQTTTLPIDLLPESRWGLGWDNVQLPALSAAGVTAWEKTGGSICFYTDFIVVPKAQLAVLVCGGRNFLNDAFYPGHIARGIALRALQEEGSIAALPASATAAQIPSQAPAPNVAAMTGIYGNNTGPIQVSVNPADGSLTLATLDSTVTPYTWAPINEGVTSYRYREDGWWWSSTSGVPSYRFEVVPGEDSNGNSTTFCYLMTRAASGDVSVLAQQLPRAPALDAVWQQRVGTQWTISNESTDSTLWKVAPNVMEAPTVIGSLNELSGYVLLTGGGPILQNGQLLLPVPNDSARARMAVNMFRDLNEVAFGTVNGIPTMTVGSRTFTPAS